MFIITKKDIIFYGIMTSLILVTIFIPMVCTTSKMINVNADTIASNTKIIIDAGHGEPDGGAVSKDGIKESELNLQIAKKLASKLKESNFEVLMTREDENNIASESMQNKKIREIKTNDLNNRVKIANESGASILVSIHMNKFEDSKYRGWQTFYSKNSEEGKKLAENIQSSISECIEYDNKRTALKIEGIKIIDKSTIPAVIVECGFLSNEEECRLLQEEMYQDKLAEGIKNGIIKYFSSF